jgi:hypothetical protein
MTALATIHELDGSARPLRSQPDLVVDFNPQSLRLTHETTGPRGAQQPDTGNGRAKQTSPPQLTGFGSDLSLDLLFDTSRAGTDVRDRTVKLVELARPAKDGSARSVRFTWGSFFFNGIIRTLGETIDLFGADGMPLRATVSVTVTGVAERDSRPGSAGALGLGAGAGLSAGIGASAGIGVSAGAGAGVAVGAGASAGLGASFGTSLGAGVGASAGAGVGGSAGAGVGASFSASASASASASFAAGASASASFSASAGVGTTPLRLTTAGDTVQSVAARAGVSWKALAAANGIDNPRRLPPGTLLDVRVAVR